MFADAVELLAVLLGVGWLGILVLAVARRRALVALLVAAGTAVLLFGGLAVLGDGIDDAGGGATRLDAAAEAVALSHRTPVLTTVTETLDVAGSLVGFTVLAGVAAAVLLHRRRRVEAALVLAAPLAAGLLGSLSKLGYDRPRPPVAGHLVTVTDSSLPSGHTLDATIVLGVLALVAVTLLHRRWARTAVVAAAVVGVAVAGTARVYLGVHWATDVLAGWLLGGAWVALSAAALLLLPRPRATGPSPSLRTAGPRPATRNPVAARNDSRTATWNHVAAEGSV